MRLNYEISKITGKRAVTLSGVLLLAFAVSIPIAVAQVVFTPGQIDDLVDQIALYPDALLAQVLSASTYQGEVQEAAAWADGHSYLKGDELADAIKQDNLPWDPSVLALLPFPSVLDMMASDVGWTQQLGSAVLGQRADVMDEIQKLRHQANKLGYLQDGAQYQVVSTAGGFIEILSVDPGYYFLPVYDPTIVFFRPRNQLSLGITFGPRIAIGTIFEQWGWRRSGFEWPSHSLVLDSHPWLRTPVNRQTYSHPYRVSRPPVGPRVERHELHPIKHPASAATRSGNQGRSGGGSRPPARPAASKDGRSGNRDHRN